MSKGITYKFVGIYVELDKKRTWTLHWLLLNLNSSLTRIMTLCAVKVHPSPSRKDNTSLEVSLQVRLNDLFILEIYRKL